MLAALGAAKSRQQLCSGGSIVKTNGRFTREQDEWQVDLPAGGLVTTLCARLMAQARLLPRCYLEVWAEDNESGAEAELAYCQASVMLGNDVARVDWLGRSRGRHVHERVRGNRCVTGAEAGDCITVAQAVLGLTVAILGRFGATEIELHAQDTGSGRLFEFYKRHGLSFFECEQKEWTMRGPLAVCARSAPASWVDALVPHSFDGNAWLSALFWNQSLGTTSPQGAVVMHSQRSKPRKICDSPGVPARGSLGPSTPGLQSKSQPELLPPMPATTQGPTPPTLKTAGLERWIDHRVACNMWNRTCSPELDLATEDVTREGSGRPDAGDGHRRPQRASRPPSALSPLVGSQSAGRLPSRGSPGKRSKEWSAAGVHGPVLSKLDLAFAPLNLDPGAVESRSRRIASLSSDGPPLAGDKAWVRSKQELPVKTPECAVATMDVQTNRRVADDTKTFLPASSKPEMPATTPDCTSVASLTEALGSWRWPVDWPSGARLHARVTRSTSKPLFGRASERIRIHVKLCCSEGNELACCSAALPPERRFLRVLWIGRGRTEPVHPSVRGQSKYVAADEFSTDSAQRNIASDASSESDCKGCTAAMALLGLAAFLASRLGAAMVELHPDDSGSGRLVRYFETFGFATAAPRSDGLLSLETPCEALGRRCCPLGWRTKL